MGLSGISYVMVVLVFTIATALQVKVADESFVYALTSRCAGVHLRPLECPYLYSKNPQEKVCFVNCNSPICSTQCRYRVPICNGLGAASYDPRFIGGDGVVFYFHGRKNEQFSLVSDTALQINGRFIGHRPAGRTQDNTWIPALRILFKLHSFSLEATRATSWDNEVDHLKFTYGEKELVLPEGSLSLWYSPDKDIKIERIFVKNNALVTLKDMAEIMVSVVPITKEDDRIHKYQLPSNDCFAHLEV